MEPNQQKIIWTDPRTGTEYDILAGENRQDDKPWLATSYLVRNRVSGEQASFPYESWEELQEFLTRLADEAEGFIRQRSKRNMRFALRSTGNRVVGTVVRGAKALRWRKQA